MAHERAATMRQVAPRDFKQVSKRAFDAQAATYDKEMQGSHARILYPHVVREVVGVEPQRALDMGCGTGALAELVLAEVPECALVGIDLSEEMLECARARLGHRADLHLGDSERLPYSDESFDVVYCNDSFHHYPEPEKAVFEAWRVLVPGGVFVIGDCWLANPARAIMNAFLPYGDSGDVRIYSESETRELLGRWFSEVAWRRVGRTSCIARAVK